ncbi:dehydrogenase [Cenarchaeum symbiosum A]|uniref:Dehydrogenase n=1 Tax=Cenarchaeum symbiosum (strain A) TaxID=414004 RepID=A0RTS5_CENSY|nr:dehydrogenase [Cenarchaeum symbiosum A]
MADYDVIVAGGGLAGTVTAQSVLKHGPGLSVLVVDKSPETMPGKKNTAGWICGDAVSKEAVDYMTENIGVKWGEPEIEHKVKGVMAFSPDRETSIPFDGDGYMLNRQLLPERQNERTINMGVKFEFEKNLTGLIIEDGLAAGVKGVDAKTREPFRKTCRLVIDATGMTSLLRGQAYSDKVEKRIDRHDIESTGRYIMYFEPGIHDTTEFDPDYCIIHLDQDIAPGGYGWVFPKGDKKVNIGLGVEKSLLESRNARMNKKDTVNTLMDEYLARNKAIENPRLSEDGVDKNNATGIFQVSVRRQNDCMVAGGYILVGDSAWMPKPLDAGGIGPALVAGSIAGRCAAEALEANDPSEAGLWKYNKEFINEYGYKTAGLELFRRLIQTLTNEQINYGMKHFLGNLDVESISKGEHPDFGGLGKIGMIIRGALNKRLADGLRFTTKQNKWLVEHYRSYPESPGGFAEWNKELHRVLDESNARLEQFAN